MTSRTLAHASGPNRSRRNPDRRQQSRRCAGEVPPEFLAGADPSAYHVAVARLDGESVATALAYEFDGDCGTYNVGTLAHARRRGLGTAVAAALLHDARSCGCDTALTSPLD